MTALRKKIAAPTARPRKVKPKLSAKVIKLDPSKRKSFELTPLQRENLILDHRTQAQKIARSILRKWHSRLDAAEVDSIVDLSLCEAAKRFHPRFGASFITFLFYHMRGNLIRAVSDAANLNTIPVTDSEIESNLNLHAGICNRAGSNSMEIADALTGEDLPLPDENLFKRELLKLSDCARDNLDPIAREVIERIFIKEQQLTAVANELGYSRCHVSRIKRRALEDLFSALAKSLEIPLSKRPNYSDDEEKLPRRRISGRRKQRLALLSDGLSSASL